MAIGAIHLAWLRRLLDKKAFHGLTSLIDLGPQDIQIARPILEPAMRGALPEALLQEKLSIIYRGDEVNPNAQSAFYELFGLGPYSSLDVDDARATYKVDLNMPVSQLPEFDVVTNFGTTEHVFNIGEAFRSIHAMTAPGGISVHCVPAFAFINHGFYNMHPNAFIEMARANRYELIDFTYLDNAFVRNVVLSREGIGNFDLSTLPISLADMEDTQVFMTKIVDLYDRNLRAKETKRAIRALNPGWRNWLKSYPSRSYHLCFVFDLLFIALRHPQTRAEFIMPIQNPTGVAPLTRQDA